MSKGEGMAWLYEHWLATLALVWFEGMAITYVWLIHADQNPKLSADEKAPPVMELAIAAFWFLTVPMMLVGKTVEMVQGLVAKFKH